MLIRGIPSPNPQFPKRLQMLKKKKKIVEDTSIRPNLRLRGILLPHFRKGTNRCLRRSSLRRWCRAMRRRRHTARNTRPVIIKGAPRATAKYPLITKIPLLIIETELRHFICEFFAIMHMVSCKQVILDPEDLVDSPHERDLSSQR